ncbi:MAG: hypothetical protein JW395_3669 [Nitrospira sp.]|nr:hypothetical protein [Nitrospira sp.]
MSTPALDVRLFLVNLGSLGTIIIGKMPASPDVMGAINEYGGQTPEGAFGVAGVKYEKPSLQIVFRGDPNDYAGPMAKARIAWAALAAVQPGVLTGASTTFLTIVPQQSPFSLGVDENKRFEIACNFYCTKELG